MVLHAFVTKLIRLGRLSIVYGDGSVHNYGDGSGPQVSIRLTRAGVERIARGPELGLGEAYMEGDLIVERGDIWDLLALVGRNLGFRRKPGTDPVSRLVNAARRRILQANDRIAARRNVAHHYDLSFDLYQRFLDEDMQYSCAYFASPDLTLEQAQAAKKAHIAAKLRLKPGMRVLDIGCGWGGLGLTLARDYGAVVTGVTLSTEQLAVARRRAEEDGLAERAQFQLTDYRDVRGEFDRIVSVGMFEHVGVPNYRTFFDCVNRRLAPDGVAVIHSIGRTDPPSLTNPFIRKYIFPGGYIPALSEVTSAVEPAGLLITDVEVLRLHYAETLRCWRERFMSARASIALLYDERFCRMWEFYLAVSELSFRTGKHMVFHLQLAKQVEALPITRGYIDDAEAASPAASLLRRKRTRA